MDAQEELDRLAAAMGKALGVTAKARVLPYAGETEAFIVVGDLNRTVETAAHVETEDAVAELRAILRADTSGAVADVLDELAAEAERGPITAEMLRTMAAARRAR